MFVDGTANEVNAQVQRLKQGQSIMDTVMAEAKDFQRGLGKPDREKLDELRTRWRAAGGGTRDLVLEIVMSPLFRTR